MSEPQGRISDRRRMGVTFFSILRSARRLSNDPAFEPESSSALSRMILEDIINKNLPQARSDMPEIDWDALLAFIEKILPIILKLLSLF